MTYGSEHKHFYMTLIDQLKQTKAETLQFFDLEDNDLEKTYAPGKWPIRYVLHHLSDAESVLFDRIRRIISEPRQVLWAFDQDAWAEKLKYDERPLELSKQLYRSTRDGVIHYSELYYETRGDLEFVHSETGVRTLKDEFEKVARHNRNHLDQIHRALMVGN